MDFAKRGGMKVFDNCLYETMSFQPIGHFVWFAVFLLA